MLQQTVYNYTHSSQNKDYFIFKDISILIYGNIVTNELSLRQELSVTSGTKVIQPGMPDVNSGTVLAILGWLATLGVTCDTL